MPDAANQHDCEYRIEADCAMRDYDGLELDAGVMHKALTEIAEGRRNQAFDPWARETAQAALKAVEHLGW